MNIIDKLKNFFQNRKTKRLPPAHESTDHTQKNKSWILSSSNNGYSNPTKLDNEIESFLNSYYNNLLQFGELQSISNYNIAYSSLATLNASLITQEEYNKNYYDEQNFLKQLSSTNQYTVEEQYNQVYDNIEFYHIKSNGYQMPEYKDMLRIYINCNNGNIAELSQAVLASNMSTNFYMKFAANPQNSNQYSRNEKIVIYCHYNEFEHIIQILEAIRIARPDLFVESEKTIPFLQPINGIASCSRQPSTNQYIDLYGQTRIIPQSTNAFLTNILEESYMSAVREISRLDSNLNFLLEGQNIDDETLYMKNYPYINQNYHDYLLKSMQAKMQVLSSKNDIYIDGLFKDNSYGRDNTYQESRDL